MFTDRMNNYSTSKEFLVRMGVDLASHCHPYWQTEGEASVQKLGLYIPSIGKDDTDSISRLLLTYCAHRKDATMSVAECQNPFIIMAYTTEGVSDLSQVDSLDYWQQNSDLSDRLQQAEEPSSAATLTFDDNDCMGGQGYTSPIYVTETELSDCRWRPWLRQEETSHEKTRRSKALRALSYALMEPTPKMRSKLNALGGTEWSFPLLQIADNSDISFSRSEYQFDSQAIQNADKVQENLINPAWEEGTRLANGIDRALSALQGQEVETGPNDANEGAAMLDNIIRESDEFWDEYAPKVEFGQDSILVRELRQEQVSRFNYAAKEAKQNGNTEASKIWAELRELTNELLYTEDEN